MLVPILLNTLRDRSRIAGRRAGEGGSAGAPRRRSGPSSHRHRRLRTTGRHRGQWRTRNVGWWPGDGNGGKGAKGKTQWTVSPMSAGRRIASPFPPSVGRRLTIGRRRGRMARNSRDGRVFHVARQGEAFHALSRRFATISGFANPLPVSRRHLYALYFLINVKKT